MGLAAILLTGCSSLRGPGGAEGPAGDPLPPGLVPEHPAPATFVSAGDAELDGLARGLVRVTLDGAPLTVSDGRYRGDIVLDRGVRTFDLLGAEADGAEHRLVYSVIAGDTSPTEGPARGAIALHAGGPAIEGLAPMLESLLDPTVLLGAGSGAPIVDDGQYTVWIDGITVGGFGLRAIPTDGSLLLGIELQGLVVDLSVEASVLFIPIELDAHLIVDDAELLTELVLGTDGQGGLTVDVQRPQLAFGSVEVDVEDIADFIEDLFLSDADAQQMLEDELDGLTDQIPALVDDLVAQLDGLTSIETDLLGTSVALQPSVAAAGVTEDGVDVVLDLQLTVGDGAVGPYLSSAPPPQPAGDGLTVLLSDDLVNRALTDLWAGGALDIELPIEAGSVESAILLLFGGAGGAGALNIEAGLPPVLVERDGQSRVQVGEWVLSVDVPGGKYGDHLELGLAADLAATFVFDGTSVGVALSDAELVLVPRGDADPELVAQLPNITAGMGAGISLLNGMLSFPLDGLLGGASTPTTTGASDSPLAGLVLPPMAFDRDGSHLATRIDAELTGWDPSAP